LWPICCAWRSLKPGTGCHRRHISRISRHNSPALAVTICDFPSHASLVGWLGASRPMPYLRMSNPVMSRLHMNEAPLSGRFAAKFEASEAPAARGRIGVLLINLGTPDGTSYWPMRRYLKEF